MIPFQSTIRKSFRSLSVTKLSASELLLSLPCPLWFMSPDMCSSGARWGCTTETPARGELALWDDHWAFPAAGEELHRCHHLYLHPCAWEKMQEKKPTTPAPSDCLVMPLGGSLYCASHSLPHILNFKSLISGRFYCLKESHKLY